MIFAGEVVLLVIDAFIAAALSPPACQDGACRHSSFVDNSYGLGDFAAPHVRVSHQCDILHADDSRPVLTGSLAQPRTLDVRARLALP
jgi:hypothetical protein